MKNAVAILAVAVSVLTGWSVRGEVARTDALYGASFEGYAVGEALQPDKGAHGGTWGRPAVPSGMEAFADKKTDGASSGTTNIYMVCYTTSTESNVTGIAFTPVVADERARQDVEMSIRSGVCKTLPTFPKGAKTGFAVYAPEGGTTSLVCWAGAAQCWTNLSLRSGVELPPSLWYDVMAKFLRRNDGRLLVQYLLNIGGSFELLQTQDGEGAVWLDLGNVGTASIVRKIEFRGNGGIEYVNGSRSAQGLYVGVGRWYDVTSYDAAYTNDYGKGTWFRGFDGKQQEDPTLAGEDEGIHAYKIDVGKGEEPNVYRPNKRRTASESLEMSVRFTSTSRDESVPAGTCARVRMVAEPGMTDVQTDPTYRFACLANGKWETNTTVRASFEKDYVFQILLDSNAGTVTYRVKEGIGYDSGAYTTLATVDGVPSGAFGSYSDIYFEGSGLVYKIKGTDRTSDE